MTINSSYVLISVPLSARLGSRTSTPLGCLGKYIILLWWLSALNLLYLLYFYKAKKSRIIGVSIKIKV